MNINQSNVNINKESNLHITAIGDELMAGFIGQSDDDKILRLGEKDAKKKGKKSGKPSSIALFNQETGVKDLLSDVARKFGQRPVQQAQKRLQKQVEKEMDKSIKDFFKNEFKDKSQDSITLSKNVTEYAKDQVKKQSKPTAEGTLNSETGEAKALAKALKGPVSSLLANNNPLIDSSASQTESTKAKQAAQAQNIAGGDPKLEQKVKNYLSAYVATMVKPDPKKKQEAKILEKQLLSQGIPSKKLRKMEENVQKMMRSDIRKQIRKAFLDVAMTYTPTTMTATLLEKSEQLKTLSQMGNMAEVFGAGRGSMDEEINAARSEIRTFIADELDQTLPQGRTSASSGKDIAAAFDQFNLMAGLVKFDSEAYMQKFQQKLENLGLTYFEDPDKIRILDSDQRNAGEQGGQGKREQSQSDLETEELLEDEIRSLYMQQAVKPDIRSQIQIRIRLRKLRNAMTISGQEQTDAIKQLKKEGQVLAKIRLIDLLKEALEERASLTALDGPGFNLVKNKLKLSLKGLKKIGQSLKRQEMKDIRDQINKGMFSVVREEYMKVEVNLELAPNNVMLLKQKRDYKSILDRLKKESNIREDIKPKIFQNLTFSSDTNVIEAA